MFRTLLHALLLLPWLATGAHGFSTQAATCSSPAASSGLHGFPSAGTGGFSLVATSDGLPVTQVTPGETIDVTLTRPAGYLGLLIRANEGSDGGSPVGGLSPTGPLQQLEPACTIPGSGISQTSSVFRTSDVVSWTVPTDLAAGTIVVISAYPVVGLLEWYGADGTLGVSLEVVEPVPALHPAALLVLFSALVAAMSWVLRTRLIQPR